MRICSNLCTEECVFVLQQIHPFIIEQLLCAWHGAKTEAVTRGRQLHGAVGGGLQTHIRNIEMHLHLVEEGTKCLGTREEGRINSAPGGGKNFWEAFAFTSREFAPRRYRSRSCEVPKIAFRY